MVRHLARFIGHPLFLVLIILYHITWLTIERGNIGWDGWATSIALVVASILQNSNNRDRLADEVQFAAIVKAIEGVPNELADLGDAPIEQLKELKKHETGKD